MAVTINGYGSNSSSDPGRVNTTATRTAAAAPRWRGIVAGALIVLFCLLATASLLVVWSNAELTDTDRYLAIVTAVAAEPAVQDVVTERVTTWLFTQVDVEQAIRNALPEDQRILAPPLRIAFRQYGEEIVRGVLASDRFAQLWAEANRRAHQAALAILSGESGATVEAANGRVVLDLTAVVAEVQARLAAEGVDLFANVQPAPGEIEIVLIDSPALARAGDLLELLGRLAVALPILALASLLLALLVAPSRRRALFWAGVGLLVALAALMVEEAIVRAGPGEVAAALIDAVLRSFRVAGLLVVAAGLLLVVIALAAGAWRRDAPT